MIKIISVIGLGKLGLCIACVLAKDFKVIGIDNNEKHINDLRFGINSIKETNLDKWYNDYRKNITFTNRYDNLGDITFIIVPTPSLENHKFTSFSIEEVLLKIHKKQIVIIISTIMPGEINRLQKQFPHLILYYNPTFIALGNVIKNFRNPDFILIGADKKKGLKELKNIYNKICFKIPEFIILLPIQAEIAKLALNCYITTKITFANQIGNLCYRLGISANNILKAIGRDRRIGNEYFKAGFGYGGGCFPRDNLALSAYFSEMKVMPTLFQTIHNLNKQQVNEITNRIIELNPKSIGFESLSYKKGTDSEECSQLKEIEDRLAKKGYKTIIGKGEVNLNHWEIKK